MSPIKQFVELIANAIGSQKLVLADVGAAGGIQRRWRPFTPIIKTIGFEPNRSEFEKLTLSSGDNWINAAVAGSAEPRTVHLTRHPNNSSLLLPNYDLIRELEWSNDFDIVSEHELDCVTLDHALSDLQPFFLKLDTQGSEHEILSGSQQILSENVVGIELEVTFCELYQNQRQFADIDYLLRENKFYIQDLANFLFVKPRGISRVGWPKSRLIQADALYYKEPKALIDGDNRQTAAALVSYVAYGYPELGVQLLNLQAARGRHFPEAEKMRSLLHRMKPVSSNFCWVPGWGFAAKCFKRLWLTMRPVSHSLWESELGNRI